MSLFAFHADPEAILVADASAVIGLNASGHARRIIELTERRLVVPVNAANELALGAQFGHDDSSRLDALVAARLVEQVALDGEALTIYEALVDGSLGETLDDGEAATIAIAVRHGAVAVLDERKARRMCAQHFPTVIQGCTAQWLLTAVGLGKIAHAEAMLNALQRGRMRVPAEYLSDVVALIGPEAAAACPSLPRLVRYAGSIAGARVAAD